MKITKRFLMGGTGVPVIFSCFVRVSRSCRSGTNEFRKHISAAIALYTYVVMIILGLNKDRLRICEE